MHRRSIVLCLLALLGLAPVPALAQQRAKFEITAVRVGWQGSTEEEGALGFIYKAGQWSPVFVDVKVGKGGLKGTEGLIDVVVETPDADDVLTYSTTKYALEQKQEGQTFTILTYAMPARGNADVNVSLRVEGQTLATTKSTAGGGSEPARALYVTLGSRVAVLRKTLGLARNNSYTAWEQAAFVEKMEDLPTNWFVYQAADLIVLPASHRELINQLGSGPGKPRAAALAEWVRRGGHLVVSLGENHPSLTAVPELDALLPVTVDKIRSLKKLNPGAWPSLPAEHDPLAPPVRETSKPFEVCVLKDKAGFDVTKVVGDTEAQIPLVVRASVGLGSVTVTAFDLDHDAFTHWDARSAFCRGLVQNAWPRRGASPVFEGGANPVEPGVPPMQKNMNVNQPLYQPQSEPELYNRLYGYLENFEEVPVIPFSWVALFIFVYILIVGPLDYFILKKVVKRLELTWITFPTVVLVVSAGAYFSAYYLKGNDLRIRKVDVVDLDLRSQPGEVVGHTWFTLFSPRIQHYTIGLDAAPSWATAARESPGPVVSWMGRPDMGRGSRAQSFFRHSYDFAENASGLKGVPIQVWSTKSFQGEWRANLGDDPMVSAELRRGAGADGELLGKLTWRPNQEAKDGIPLRDAYLVYRGRVHGLPNALEPGTPQSVDRLGDETTLAKWASLPPPQNLNPYNNFRSGRFGAADRSAAPPIDPVIRGAFFFAASEGHAGVNADLRALDHSWLAERDDVALLVGRLLPQRGPAGEVVKSDASPSRLWLGKLPVAGDTAKPPTLDGFLHQDTFVRVIIPVKAAGEK